MLPGIGPVATISLLLPITFGQPATTAIIMLAGIYYGAQYGGSTTAILLNLPGEVSSVVTTLEGYKMARNGRAGAALTIAALGSFFAGSVATILVAASGPLLTQVALSFGPADYFSLMFLGLIISAVLAQGSVIKSIGMVVFGVSLGMVGTDVQTGQQRFTFGIPELSDGVGFVSIAMGMFGIAEIILNLERPESRSVMSGKVGSLMMTRAEVKRSIPSVLRGTAVGSHARHPAGRRRGAVLLRVVHDGAQALEVPPRIRHRCDRGRGRSGIGQQRRLADLLHPAAHPRHPGQRRDGADGRRADHPGHPARARAWWKPSRTCSGA